MAQKTTDEPDTIDIELLGFGDETDKQTVRTVCQRIIDAGGRVPVNLQVHVQGGEMADIAFDAFVPDAEAFSNQVQDDSLLIEAVNDQSGTEALTAALEAVGESNYSAYDTSDTDESDQPEDANGLDQIAVYYYR